MLKVGYSDKRFKGKGGREGEDMGLSLQEMATSTLHQFSQETPMQFSPHRAYHKKKNPKISTWYNDQDGRYPLPTSTHHKHYRNRSEYHESSRNLNQRYESPTNMLLQLTNSLKATTPKYIYKLKLKKHGFSRLREKNEQERSLNRAKVNFSTHIIPTPMTPPPSSSPSVKKKTGTAIKKIKSQMIQNTEYRRYERQRDERDINRMQTRQKTKKGCSFESQNQSSSFSRTGLFRASIVLKTKRKQCLQQDQRQKMQKNQIQDKISHNIEVTPQFQLLSELIQLQKI